MLLWLHLLPLGFQMIAFVALVYLLSAGRFVLSVFWCFHSVRWMSRRGCTLGQGRLCSPIFWFCLVCNCVHTADTDKSCFQLCSHCRHGQDKTVFCVWVLLFMQRLLFKLKASAYRPKNERMCPSNTPKCVSGWDSAPDPLGERCAPQTL